MNQKEADKACNELKKIYADLGFDFVERGRDYIADMIADKEQGVSGAIGRDYSRDIAYALADDIAEDLHVSADHEDWGMDDVRLAFGRVMCAKLGIQK